MRTLVTTALLSLCALPAAAQEVGNVMNSGNILTPGQYIAGSKKTYVIMQADANLCFYRGTGPADNKGRIWCSSTTARETGAYFAIMQEDANLCVYKGTGPADNKGKVWCSGSNQAKTSKGYTLGMTASQVKIFAPLVPRAGGTPPRNVLWQAP